MCSILGASFAPNSTINRRSLLNALLSAGEVRGRDASGYAFVAGEASGIYKKNVPGSKLHTGKLPADAEAFIAHTRAATHGSPENMDNNHPIESPGGTIRLVHNGVISNHNEARQMLGGLGELLPEVDSSVIPAFIEAFSLDATEHLRGDATAAWFDDETGATIHLAKFNHNPISIAWLEDGSFVFASTPQILGAALRKAGLRWFGHYPEAFDSFAQGEYIQVLGGDVIHEGEVEWDTTYHYAGANNWRAVTSGATTVGTPNSGGKTVYGTDADRAAAYAPSATTVKGSENDTPMVLSSLEQIEDPEEDDDRPAGIVLNGSGGMRIVGDPDADFWPYGDELGEDAYDFWVQHGHLPGEEPTKRGEDEPNAFLGSDRDYVFYVVEHDGDYTTYKSLHGLVQNLSWLSGMVTTGGSLVGPDEGKLKWVNHIGEIGHLSEDGSEQLSWVEGQDNFAPFEHLTPSFVKDGIGKLRQLVGA